MRFLLSNDDGYQAVGISLLAEAIATLGEIDVVAPDRDKSGASNSLTLDSPLRVNQDSRGFHYVNGTPTDCVHLAITGLLEHEPDIVISGINNGTNMGDDVLYSGTVAAAMEARYLGCPAIAVSLAGQNPENYQTAVKYVLEIINSINQSDIDKDMLLNINVPDVPYEKVTGVEVTRLGNRHKSEPAIKTTDPKGKDVYWVGPVGLEQDAGPGTDFYAIKQNRVSITPLHVDLTHYKKSDELKQHFANVWS